ncbi:DUF6932 family protein [Azospirillum largimobile]
MSIPAFNNDGVIPPFLGEDPGGSSAQMSPYSVTALQIVERFGTDANRIDILGKWLAHREALRTLGVPGGLQWLDGSFVENKTPNDLDVVSFLKPPASLREPREWRAIFLQNPSIFNRTEVKLKYRLDAFFINLDGSPEALVSFSRYFLQLFSHQRDTFLWKGMLEVSLNDPADDADALTLLTELSTKLSSGSEGTR